VDKLSDVIEKVLPIHINLKTCLNRVDKELRMKKYLITNVRLVNEGLVQSKYVLIENGRIAKISDSITAPADARIIDGNGAYLLPGVIDDQVHFREPGLTHKADLFTESRAAVAGGTTSFMEMPNTVPNTLTQELLADKYQLGAQRSLANYSFFMGVSNDNYEEVMKTNAREVCGLKIFMGSSTGNMLVDNPQTLEKVFCNSGMLIATHCEDEATVKANMERYKAEYGDKATTALHPVIRNTEACYLSSSLAVSLAKKCGGRLHILHISTAKELDLFTNDIPLKDKKITSEVCIHHLWFSEEDYAEKGNLIKWNPAVKSKADREALRKALLDDRLDIVATDHAPHTLEEKAQHYWQAPSGGPLVQHSLLAMLEMSKQGLWSVEKVVEKMAHTPAICFKIENRGFIREGYWADLVLVKETNPWEVKREDLLYKCGWSPMEGTKFSHEIQATFVSGHLAYENGKFNEEKMGQRMTFDR
jgi:dihydroorotase